MPNLRLPQQCGWVGLVRHAARRMAEDKPHVREQTAPNMSQTCGEQERMSAWELASRQT